MTRFNCDVLGYGIGFGGYSFLTFTLVAEPGKWLDITPAGWGIVGLHWIAICAVTAGLVFRKREGVGG